MKTFIANMRRAVRNCETVSIGGGAFSRGELAEVIGRIEQLQRAAALALEALEWNWGGEPLATKEQEAMAALRDALKGGE